MCLDTFTTLCEHACGWVHVCWIAVPQPKDTTIAKGITILANLLLHPGGRGFCLPGSKAIEVGFPVHLLS